MNRNSFIIAILIITTSIFIGCGGGSGGGGGNNWGGSSSYSSPTSTPTTSPTPSPSPSPSLSPNITFRFDWTRAVYCGGITLGNSSLAVTEVLNRAILLVNPDNTINNYIPLNYAPHDICLNSTYWYLLDHNSGNIYRYALNWENQTHIINIANCNGISTNNLFFVTIQDGSYRVFDTSGTEQGFSPVVTGITPGEITIDKDNNVYTTDSANCQIKKYSLTGNLLLTFSNRGSADGELNNPQGIALDNSGNIYVADRGNFRFQVFDSTGNFLGKCGTQGNGNGEFQGILDIAVSPDGLTIYTSDDIINIVQKFTEQ